MRFRPHRQALRGDLTYFKQGWQGSHEFQGGFFIEPRNTFDTITRYTNDGFYLEAQCRSITTIHRSARAHSGTN